MEPTVILAGLRLDACRSSCRADHPSSRRYFDSYFVVIRIYNFVCRAESAVRAEKVEDARAGERPSRLDALPPVR